MWPFKKSEVEEIEPEEREYMSRLTVKYGKLSPFIWEYGCEKEDFSISMFRDFIKWFHCRPQSECYAVRGPIFQTVIFRNRISSYQIELIALKTQEEKLREIPPHQI